MLKHWIKNFLTLSLLFVLISPVAQAQVCVTPPTGLVAWYKAEGNVNDSSGNGHHGTTTSNAGFSSGHVGQAFLFTEQTQSVPIPNDPTLFPPTSLSVEGWVNPIPYSNCAGDSYRIFHTVQTIITGYATLITCPAGNLVGAIFDSAGTPEAVVSTVQIPTNTFTHFAVTWDGSTLRLYLNGVLNNTAPTTMPTIGTNDQLLRIGNAQAIGFLGMIDEVSLYNRALSGAEISSIFNAGTAGKCFGPTAAFVSVGGRILTSTGTGIGKVTVSLTSASGVTQHAISSHFGYYQFENVASGQSYMLSVGSKRYTFAVPSRSITPFESVTDADFVAEPLF